MAYDARLPPTRLRREDLERYREACKQDNRSMSEDLRRYIRRRGRKARRKVESK